VVRSGLEADHERFSEAPSCRGGLDNPNEVVVTHTFDSREAARAFFAMTELKDAMSEAGVDVDSVEISYFDEVESGGLVGA
jgi:heme-degrading monooxygenase HmoA